MAFGVFGRRLGLGQQFSIGLIVLLGTSATCDSGALDLHLEELDLFGTVAKTVGWIKSLAVPGLSVDLTVASVTTKRIKGQKVFAVPGRANPVVWEDVMSGRVGVLTVVAMTVADRGGLRALLSAGGPALIQFDPALGVADVFVVFADDQETPLGPRAGANSQFALSYTEIDRPATAGVSLSIPGWTNDIVLTRYATWNAFDAAFASYVAQSAGP